MGGTSNLNYMQYLRGSRHDYDEWAAHGAHGWAYKDVLPYFIKSEDNRNGEYVRTGELLTHARQTPSQVQTDRQTDTHTHTHTHTHIHTHRSNSK